jgi:hypothetical protein
VFLRTRHTGGVDRAAVRCHGGVAHLFHATVMPPRQFASIFLRAQPGWITFSRDGRYAYPSTGDVIDARTRSIVATLKDERGQAVQSERCSGSSSSMACRSRPAINSEGAATVTWSASRCENNDNGELPGIACCALSQ